MRLLPVLLVIATACGSPPAPEAPDWPAKAWPTALCG